MRLLKTLMTQRPMIFPSRATTAALRSEGQLHQVWETAGDLTGCR